MAIAFVSGSGNGGTSGSPTVNEGEVLIVGADGVDSLPSMPGDFTEISALLTTGSGTDVGMRIGWKRAGPGGFTGTGTWTNADELCWQIWSGLDPLTPIGAVSENVHSNTSGDPISFPALTLTPLRGGTWLAAFCCRVSISLEIDDAITGMVNRSDDNSGSGGSSSIASKSTTTVRATDWPATDLTIGTNAKRIAVVFELFAEPPDAPTDEFGDYTDHFTGADLASRWTLNDGTEPPTVGGRIVATDDFSITAGASAPSGGYVKGDLTERFVSAAFTITGNHEAWLYFVDDDYTNYIGWDIAAGQARAWTSLDVDPVYDEPYDFETHRAFRIFETGGVLYVQYWSGTAWLTVYVEASTSWIEDARDDLGAIFTSPESGDQVEVWSYNTLVLPLAPTLTVEPFDTTARLQLTFNPNTNDSADRHLQTHYQVTTAADTGYATPIVNVTVEEGFIVDYLTDELFTAETDYIARASTIGLLGEGAFCSSVEFTTTEGIPAGEKPTLSPVDETETTIATSISVYVHEDVAVEPEDFDPDDPHPFLAYSEIQIRLASNPDWSTPLDTVIVPYVDGDLTALFEGLSVGTSYKLRGRQFDGYLGVFTPYSDDLTRSTDAAPVTAPLTTSITSITCGRNITITGGAFAHSGAGTHANTRVRICYGSSCQTIDYAGALTTVTIEDAPGGSSTVAIAYQDNAGVWGPFSATQACDVPAFPPNVYFTNPPHGEVIEANQEVEWDAYDPHAVGWHYDVEYSATNGVTWLPLFEDRITPSFTFSIAGKPNGQYLIRVRVRNPDTDETGEWSVLPLMLDRTGTAAIHYHFADLDELLPTWRQIWDGPEHISFALRDTHDPDTDEDFRVGLEAKRVHAGSSIRRSALVFDELGQPDEFDIIVAYEHIAERCQWYPYQFATPTVTRGGSMMFGSHEGSERTGRLTLQRWDSGWYLGDQMICVSDEFRNYASAFSAKYANQPEHSNQSLRYGRSMSLGRFYTVTNRKGSETLTHTSVQMDSTTTDRIGGGYFYTDEDGVLGRARVINVMMQSVRRGTSGSTTGWNITTTIYGPGTKTTANTVFVPETSSGRQLICGSCGIGFEDMDQIGVGRSTSIIFTDFSLRVVSYGSCEPPDDLSGCEADWDFTIFERDDVTPWYGTADNEGNVGEADFYDRKTCPRPYLKPPKNFSATEIDYPAGASTIGSIRVGVVDKRMIKTDQSSGIVTAKIHDCVGHRAVLRRWREDLGMVTVFDGIIEGWELDSTTVVTYWFNLRDPRDRERNVELFSRNETFALWPEDGPIDSYGLLPNDLGYLLTPVQPQDAIEFEAFAPAGGIYSGQVTLTNTDVERQVESVVLPWSYSTYDAATGYWRFRDITVRWRLAAGGNWHYLRDMPTLGGAQAVQSPGIGAGQFTWRLYMGSTNPDDIPADGVLIDLQILAARTSPTTPFFWDRGTFGDLLLAIYRGDFTDEPPNIRYSLEALEAWALQTPNARFIAREPVDNLREWVQEHIYAPIGWAPSFDADMRIVPSAWELPPADEELVELTPDHIVPVGDFSHEMDSVINRVTYTYIRESVLPPNFDDLPSLTSLSRLSAAAQWRILRELYADSQWTRLVEEEITRDYPLLASIRATTEKRINYKPLTVRGTGLLGEALLGLFGIETPERIADRIANNVLGRYGWGAPTFKCKVLSGMAHGPTFDPHTLDLQVGQWVTCEAFWMPEYSTGKRGLRRYMQIKSLTDPDILYRDLVLEDGGAFVESVWESGSEENLLDPPTLGTLVEVQSGDENFLYVQVPVTFPGTAPTGYTARVEYAVSTTEPAADSGLWALVAYINVDGGSALTPLIHPGAKVWIRARGEVLGRRPSEWVGASTSITLSQIPGLLAYNVTIDGAHGDPFVVTWGEPTATWSPNPYVQGLRIRTSVGALGHTPSYSTYGDFDSDDLVLTLTGIIVNFEEEIYVEATAYPGFSLGSVTGSPGSVYVVRRDFGGNTGSGDLDGGSP